MVRILAATTLAATVIATLVLDAERQTRTAESVEICSLRADPPAFNHKLVEVTGVVTHGFEDFTLSDSACSKWPGIWLEYGGTVTSGTIFCCGVTADSKRKNVLTVEGVRLPLVDDAMFRTFNDRIRKDGEVKFRATLQGHFFAGERRTMNGTEFWDGYGHFGSFGLFVIQRVLAVEDGRL